MDKDDNNDGCNSGNLRDTDSTAEMMSTTDEDQFEVSNVNAAVSLDYNDHNESIAVVGDEDEIYNDPAVEVNIDVELQEETGQPLSLVSRVRGVHSELLNNIRTGTTSPTPTPMSDSERDAISSEPSDLSMRSRDKNDYNNASGASGSVETARKRRVKTKPMVAASGASVARVDPNVQELLRARQRIEAVNVSMALATTTLSQPFVSGTEAMAAVMPSTSSNINLHHSSSADVADSTANQQGPINYSTDNNADNASDGAAAALSTHIGIRSSHVFENQPPLRGDSEEANSSVTSTSASISNLTYAPTSSQSSRNIIEREHKASKTRGMAATAVTKSSACTSGNTNKSSLSLLGTNLNKHARKDVAAIINAECCRGEHTPELDSIMDTLFNPSMPIDNPDNIEWIRWIIAGGRTPQEFIKIGKVSL